MANPKFEIGQIYEIIQNVVDDVDRCCIGEDIDPCPSGTRVRITDVDDTGEYPYFELLDGSGNCSGHVNKLRLIDKEGETTMSNITNPVEALIAKAQGIDDTTKTLRKADLENTDGRMTSGGSAALLGRLWQRERADIAKDLQELEAEADKPAATPKA